MKWKRRQRKERRKLFICKGKKANEGQGAYWEAEPFISLSGWHLDGCILIKEQVRTFLIHISGESNSVQEARSLFDIHIPQAFMHNIFSKKKRFYVILSDVKHRAVLSSLFLRSFGDFWWWLLWAKWFVPRFSEYEIWSVWAAECHSLLLGYY